jgi:hypothetical protein
LLGVVLGHEGLWLPKTEADKAWERWNRDHEDAVHTRIVQLQKELSAASSAAGTGTSAVENEIRAQMAVEDLIIKSREAEYAKFNVFATSAIAAFSAVLGAIVSIALAKSNR